MQFLKANSSNVNKVIPPEMMRDDSPYTHSSFKRISIPFETKGKVSVGHNLSFQSLTL